MNSVLNDFGDEEKEAIFDLAVQEIEKNGALTFQYWQIAPKLVKNYLMKLNPKKYATYKERNFVHITLAYNTLKRQKSSQNIEPSLLFDDLEPLSQAITPSTQSLSVSPNESQSQDKEEIEKEKETDSKRKLKSMSNPLQPKPKAKKIKSKRIPAVLRHLMPYNDPSLKQASGMEKILRRTFNGVEVEKKREKKLLNSNSTDKNFSSDETVSVKHERYPLKVKKKRERKKASPGSSSPTSLTKLKASFVKNSALGPLKRSNSEIKCECIYAWCNKNVSIVRINLYEIICQRDISLNKKYMLMNFVKKLVRHEKNQSKMKYETIYFISLHHFNTFEELDKLKAIVKANHSPNKRKLKEVVDSENDGDCLFIEDIFKDINKTSDKQLKARISELENFIKSQ